MVNERKELVFAHDADAELLCFLEFGGAHVVAGKDEACLVVDAADVLAAMLFDEGFVLVAAVVLKDTADDD